METFALIFVSIFTGYIINFKKIFAQNTPIILNQFILYISLPAMVFLQIPKLTFSFDIIIPVVISYGVMAFSALFIFYISKVLQFSREVTASLMLVGVLGNTSFVGIPVIQAYFGESALPYVLIYDQLGSFIVLSTYGTFISVYYSREDNVDVKAIAIAIKIITFPTFIALLTSLFFIGTTFHPVITSVLSSLASTIIPLALVSVGLQLKFKLPKEDMKPFAVAIGVKLLLAPVIAICIAYLFTWENTVADISIIESAMGPMITAGAVASMAGLSPRLSSAVVGYGTILSLLTSWMFFTVL